MLVSMGAECGCVARGAYSIVAWAALHYNTNVLEYFISLNRDDLPVWSLLTNMLKSENNHEVSFLYYTRINPYTIVILI